MIFVLYDLQACCSYGVIPLCDKMTLAFAGHGLSLTSEVFPPPLAVIQGSDILNLTFRLDYNGTRDALLENSTACQELNKTAVFLKFVVTLPVVFDILYPTNASNHTGSIITDFSNCSWTPSVDINSLMDGRHQPSGFHILRFDILSQNVSWTASLDVQLRVLHSARAGSLLNITAIAMIANETKQFNIASYRASVPGNLQLELKSTSILETPNITLTSEEEVTLTASFELPRITANITLSITLPTFGNSTPMTFIGGSVKGLSQGIMSQRPPQFNIMSSNLHHFPHSLNVAKFTFEETVNNQANDSISGMITVEATGKVDSSQGVYVPEIEGNVTCTLSFSNRGQNIVANEMMLALELGQPLLERQFGIEGPGCCYEGNDNVSLTFEVKNPNISTAPALNVTINFDISSPHISVQSMSAVLCSLTTCNATGNQSSVYGKVMCMDLKGTEMMTNSSTGFTVNLPRLNSSCWVQGRVLTLVKPSVAVGSSYGNHLTLKYSRTGWLPLVFLETQSTGIKHVVSHLPSVISSNVPPLDGGVITIGEEMTFQMSVSLPVSTNNDFTLRVFGLGVEGVAGKITRVGSNIESLHGQIRVADFNVTSEVKGKFGTIVNTGNLSKPYDNEIEYHATVRASNASRNKNGQIVSIIFAVIAGGINQTERSLSLQIIEPDLSVSMTPSRFTGVPPDYDITFTVQLSHSIRSTSDAYRVLVEIAIPHDHLSDAQIIDSPGRGSITLMNGNEAPSGNSRYNNPSTKVFVYQSNDLPRGQTVSFKYKATTVNNLQPSIYVSSPVHLAYVTLPNTLSPPEGRKYMHDLYQGTFLTLRPDPFVSVSFKPVNGSFDGGDRVQYDLTLNNVNDQSTRAYDLSVVVTFEGLDTNRIYIACTSGSLRPFNATSGESKLIISKIDPLQKVYCNYTSFLQNRISPKRLISQTVDIEYYSLSFASYPQRVSFKERRSANFTTKPIITTIMTSENAETLQAGDPLNFTLHLKIPECVTTLTVSINLPTVPLSVIDLARRRRAIRSQDASQRSRVKRSAGLVYVLTPFLNESYVRHGNGLTVQMSPTISHPNAASLNITFGLVENLPGSGTNDTVEIFLKVATANKPLVLSGRPLDLTAILNFDAGFDKITKKFLIIGPLLKPLLSINKTVEILQEEGDSPPVVFNVTVSHANGSLYHARNLTVTDTTQGMDFYDSHVSTKGFFLRSPRKNVYVIRFTLASLRIGETRSFVYVAGFKVDEKEPSTLRIPAEVNWKSVQLNSPVYRLLSDTGTACLHRNDLDEAEPRKVFGFFALGVFLGLLIGAVIAAILVLVIIKCCDKGKMAPYYMRFTNTSTMTVLTGGSQYIYHGEDLPGKTPIEKHAEPSIVQTDESIVPVLTLHNATQTEKELNSLDVQSTATLDADLETQRQNMFIKAIKLLVKKLRVKRDISSEQERNFVLEIKQTIGAVAFKMAAEYKRKAAELRKKLQTDGNNRLDALQREQRKEREETENKIKGLVNEREKKNILSLMKKRQEAQEQELKQNLKLEQDVEMEKLRKEVSISRRFALKEAQNKLIQNVIKDANLNEEQANAIMKDHLANMAAIDKATDEERARRVMALEMRLAERRALARQKQEEEERKKRDLEKLQGNHSDALENLVRSSTLSSEDAAVYLERFKKEMEAVESKLAKERQRQEQKLHQKLTALKQKKIEEKAREHQRQIKEFDNEQEEKFEHVEIDTVTAINEKQKLLEKQRQEIEEIVRSSDREAAEEIDNLRDQQTREANQLMKNNAQKMYQELLNKGLSESEKEAILERHMADVAMQQDAWEEERRRQREILERRLEKQRAMLEKKMKEEKAEQAEIRKQEDKIVGDLIVNQVVMSEEERDRIIQEHEKNLAELESSLTLNKLRQRQILEEKLSQRRKRRMEQLQTKDRDYGDKILVEGEDIEMIKKHEQEKMAVLKEDEINLEDEMDAVREEMLAERSKKLEAHHEKLGAVIAQLQIEKAKQMSKIAMQQEALGQLQAGLIDELESKGTFQDPETQNIMEKYQKETKNLEENLKQQKERQEQALRNRLQERMRQREETLVLKQKDELSQYVSNLNVNNMAMKLRKAAMKARHEKELSDLRNRMQKEIDQSINELKMTSDIRRMQAVEAQNLKLISILIQQGKLQEEELEGVLKFLFPTKSSNEIGELLSKIYGPDHNKGSRQSLLAPRRESNLEARIRRNSSFPNETPPIRKPSKKRKKATKNKDDQPNELPPINFKGSKKGFNLNESLRGYRSLTDEEQNATRIEPRNDDEQRAEVTSSRKGSYQRLTEETNQEKVDGMFDDSSERSGTKSGKKHRRRRRDAEDAQA